MQDQFSLSLSLSLSRSLSLSLSLSSLSLSFPTPSPSPSQPPPPPPLSFSISLSRHPLPPHSLSLLLTLAFSPSFSPSRPLAPCSPRKIRVGWIAGSRSGLFHVDALSCEHLARTRTRRIESMWGLSRENSFLTVEDEDRAWKRSFYSHQLNQPRVHGIHYDVRHQIQHACHRSIRRAAAHLDIVGVYYYCCE